MSRNNFPPREDFQFLADAFLGEVEPMSESTSPASEPTEMDDPVVTMCSAARTLATKTNQIRKPSIIASLNTNRNGTPQASTENRTSLGSTKNASDTTSPLPPIDILMTSHLPVYASAWVGPCVHRLSVGGGSTILITPDQESGRIQLHHYKSSSNRTSSNGSDGHVSLSTPSLKSLRDLNTRLDGNDVNWLLRLPGPIGLNRLYTLPIRRFIILTGADQAAIVNTFQMIKQIKRVTTRIWGRPIRIGLVMVGSEHERACRAFTRLEKTAGAHLSASSRIDLAGIVSRIEPPCAEPIGHLVGQPPLLSWIVEDLYHGPASEDDGRDPDSRRDATACKACLVPKVNGRLRSRGVGVRLGL